MTATGKWNVSLKTPRGDREGTFDFTENGAALTGKIILPEGTFAIDSGHVQGNELSWHITIPVPEPTLLKCKAAVTDNSMSGTTDGPNGQATFTATRS